MREFFFFFEGTKSFFLFYESGMMHTKSNQNNFDSSVHTHKEGRRFCH